MIRLVPKVFSPAPLAQEERVHVIGHLLEADLVEAGSAMAADVGLVFRLLALLSAFHYRHLQYSVLLDLVPLTGTACSVVLA